MWAWAPNIEESKTVSLSFRSMVLARGFAFNTECVSIFVLKELSYSPDDDATLGAMHAQDVFYTLARE